MIACTIIVQALLGMHRNVPDYFEAGCIHQPLTFTLTGLPGAGSYDSTPLISNDRIWKSGDASPKPSRDRIAVTAAVVQPEAARQIVD